MQLIILLNIKYNATHKNERYLSIINYKIYSNTLIIKSTNGKERNAHNTKLLQILWYKNFFLRVVQNLKP